MSIPLNLTIESKIGALKLTWDSTENTSVDYYNIYRGETEEELELLQSNVANIVQIPNYDAQKNFTPSYIPPNEFWDTTIATGVVYYYQVTAVHDGTEYDGSNIVISSGTQSIPIDPTPPTVSNLPDQPRLLIWHLMTPLAGSSGAFENAGFGGATSILVSGYPGYVQDRIVPFMNISTSIGHILRGVYGVRPIWSNQSTNSVTGRRMMLGRQVPVSGGGLGGFKDGSMMTVVEALNYNDTVKDIVLSYASGIREVSDSGVFVMTYHQKWQHSNYDDDSIMGWNGLLIPILANTAIGLDAATTIDDIDSQSNTKSACFRTIELAELNGITSYTESLPRLGTAEHYLGDDGPGNGIVVSYDRVYASRHSPHLWEQLDRSHRPGIIFMTLNTDRINTVDELFDIALEELLAGNSVAIASNTSLENFTNDQWNALLDASNMSVGWELYSVFPTNGIQGVSYSIEILGSGFSDNSSVEFVGGGINVDNVTKIDHTKLVVNISIEEESNVGFHDIKVINSDNTNKFLFNGFDVLSRGTSGMSKGSIHSKTYDREVIVSGLILTRDGRYLLGTPSGSIVNYEVVRGSGDNAAESRYPPYNNPGYYIVHGGGMPVARSIDHRHGA